MLFDIESYKGSFSQVSSTVEFSGGVQSTQLEQLLQVVQVGVHIGVSSTQSGIGVGSGVGVGTGVITFVQLCVKHSHPQLSQGNSLQPHPQDILIVVLPLQASHP
jgi:hypothetical protein